MIFYQAVRRYRGRTRVLAEGDNLERVRRVFDREALRLHSGSVVLLADGLPQRWLAGGYNRTRW